MKTGTCSGVGMTIFSNEAMNQIVNDVAGNPVNQRKVKGINTTNAYTNIEGVSINATVVINFIDGTEYKSTDNEVEYWVSFEAFPLVKRTF
jgi:hypothetical protein